MPYALFNPLREILIKRAIERNSKNTYIAFTEQENVSPYVFKKEDKTVILLVNYCDDDYSKISLKTDRRYRDVKLVTVENPDGYKPDYTYKDGVYLVNEILKSLESAVLIFKE